MRPPTGWPKSLTALKGRKVKTRRKMSNGLVSIAAGTTMTVGASNRWNSIGLEGPRCEHCGVAPYIRGVHFNELELLPVGP